MPRPHLPNSSTRSFPSCVSSLLTRFVLLFAVSWVLIGCGSEMNPPDGSSPGMDSGPGSDGGNGPCSAASDCDDGVDCTEDTCGSSGCRHVIVPSLCPAGSSCVPGVGCMMGAPCADDMDCQDAEPCTTNERCDPASRVCVTDPLDGDDDGDPPRSCGGGDCDDSDDRVFTGAEEWCNGRDDDCDGTTDEGASFTDEGVPACRGDDITNSFAECTAGSCGCIVGAIDCGGTCSDTSLDSRNCGACGDDCGIDSTGVRNACVGGACVCPAGSTHCPGAGCVNTASDPRHCGGCGSACAGGCVGSTCVPCDAHGSPCCAGMSGPLSCTWSRAEPLECLSTAPGETCTPANAERCSCSRCGLVDSPCCGIALYESDGSRNDGCYENSAVGRVACDTRTGMCTRCGRSGQPCCQDPRFLCTDAGSVCTAERICS